MSDERDDERREATPFEGVRILGAEEARAVLGQRDEAEPDDAHGDEPALEAERARRFPADGPTWSASSVPDRHAEPAPSEPQTGEVPALPHWTEPPTGAVPAIFAEDLDAEPDADELDAWSSFAGNQPRFRAEGSDWAEADFADDELSELTGENAELGALASAEVVDDDEAFAQELAQRRRRTPRGRAARTMVTTPPPAAATPRPRVAEPHDAAELAPPGPTAARDLPTAIITAAAVAVVALVCFRQGTFWTALLAAAVVGLGTVEFAAALQARGFRPASLLALVASAGLPIAAREFGAPAYPVFFALLVVFSMLWFLWEVTPGRPLLGVATTVLAFAYVGGLGGFAGLLLAADDGVGLLLGVVLCTIAYDVFGFFVGSQFGKSPIAPKVSPHKSFEGTLAGMLAAVLVGWLVVGQIHPWSPAKSVVLGLFVAAGAFLGDLCESMLKRDLGIKDFGSLLPGHGGVLDRFDSLLFCLPIAYFLALHLDIV
ncbi:MAG: phosphatidate cytidylyltransferase [Acidimicrobiia bacterium]|nr:MAG: phosphatidate cytidylyltransferase [Acidimicrobiia bacterium]